LALYAARTFLWINILKQIPLSTTYPLAMGTTIVVTFIVGMIIDRESFSAVKAIGVCLIIIAMYLLAI